MDLLAKRKRGRGRAGCRGVLQGGVCLGESEGGAGLHTMFCCGGVWEGSGRGLLVEYGTWERTRMEE
jgi:hypothetical protein